MRRSSVLLALALGGFVSGCGDRPGPSGPGTPVDIARAQPGEVLRLDDYPLYYMRTSSDYGFDGYRRGAAGAAGAAKAPLVDASRRRSSWACTCFATAPAGEGPLFGRNFDWRNHASLLLYTTPPNALASLSMVDLHYVDFGATVGLDELRAQRDRIAQRAPYVPFDGVNEKGVAIGLMAVPSAEPPFDPGKVSL